MIIHSPYTLSVTNQTFNKDLYKGTWLVVLHVSRIPPHIGIVIDGNYNSLTIKGHELNINLEVLIKTIQKKNIEALFIKLQHHPVFSGDFQKEICQHYIQQFTQVKPNEASCLSPVKLFLQEFYALQLLHDELLFELMERLKQNQYIKTVMGINIDKLIENGEVALPVYTQQELQEVIKQERLAYYKD